MSIDTPTTGPESAPSYDRGAIFEDSGPFQPAFMRECVRTLMRALPLDPAEPQGWRDRRMYSALLGLSALHPRDEIEVMLSVQALCAYHAATACWHIGMNLRSPSGDSTRHISAAASAARTFDTMLRALERRQAKPLAVPVGRPEPRAWVDPAQPTEFVQDWHQRCQRDQDLPARRGPPEPPRTWTPQAVAAVEATLKQKRTERENKGLDIANTEGILPGGGMILMDDPTPYQAAYMERRLGLMYEREYQENLRKGIDKRPKIRGLRVGDLVP